MYLAVTKLHHLAQLQAAAQEHMEMNILTKGSIVYLLQLAEQPTQVAKRLFTNKERLPVVWLGGSIASTAPSVLHMLLPASWVAMLGSLACRG
jgi:hypothetical protein